jgi:uncharacterized protein YggE
LPDADLGRHDERLTKGNAMHATVRPAGTKATLIAGLLAGLLGLPALAPAARAAVDRPFPLITVTGEGTVTAKADVAHASAGVVSEGKSPREASDANAKAMTAVIVALREAGLGDADIRTARFSITPIYANRERGGPAHITGFRVSNQVTATVRDFARLGEILDRLVGAGANEISGVSFSLSDPAKPLDQARTAAVMDARRKAELLARAAGAQVGRAVNIAEEEAQPPRPYMMRMAAPAAAPTTPIEPGEETLRTRVTVSFELNQ